MKIFDFTGVYELLVKNTNKGSIAEDCNIETSALVTAPPTFVYESPNLGTLLPPEKGRG
jgi:hypothetical protein